MKGHLIQDLKLIHQITQNRNAQNGEHTRWRSVLFYSVLLGSVTQYLTLCVFVLQGDRVWVRERGQLHPCTVSCCYDDGSVVFTSDYGEVRGSAGLGVSCYCSLNWEKPFTVSVPTLTRWLPPYLNTALFSTLSFKLQTESGRGLTQSSYLRPANTHAYSIYLNEFTY